jgi:DMSO reductase anchor subunit
MYEEFTFSGKVMILWAAGLSGLLGLLHLGKKGRALFALANLKSSWLSREILWFGLFYILVGVDMFLTDLPQYVIVIAGAFFLISIDMVYRPAGWRWPLKIHSAQSVFIALNLVLLLESWPVGLGVIVIFRSGLYVYRHARSETVNLIRPGIRMITLIISCLALLVLDATVWALIFFCLGEFIDRTQFYNELNVPDPGEEIA